MELFWKTAAAVLIAVVLIPAVARQEKDLAVLLAMAVCLMAGFSAFSLLEPVVDFFYRLSEFGGLHTGTISTLLKITGLALVSEFAQMICQDSGNYALAKGMQLVGTAVILTLSIPILETLLECIGQILGEL